MTRTDLALFALSGLLLLAAAAATGWLYSVSRDPAAFVPAEVARDCDFATVRAGCPKE